MIDMKKSTQRIASTFGTIGPVCLRLAFVVAFASKSLVAADSKIAELANASDVKAAGQLASQLQANDSIDVIAVLDAMQGATPTGKNWLLSVAQTIADRDAKASKTQLAEFLESEAAQDAAARYWAFDYVTAEQPEARNAFLRTHLDDPSLDIRYEAIQLGMQELKNSDSSLSEKERLAKLQQMLTLARLPEQVQAINEELESLDAGVQLLKHFGFVTEWQLLGPFDNSEQAAFDKVYEPEAAYAASKLDLKKTTAGKSGDVSWQPISTEEENGALKIAEALEKEKGAVAYLQGSFESPAAMECELRIGTPNATKVWLNGELVISREVYHSGTQIDQYITQVKLKPGTNSIFVKSCQNEQTQPWAQDWEFQLRFTDETGAAIKPAK
ncbi:MAG: hypothetical protein AAGG44_05565 [Planctomycetota bacterium]